MTKGQLSIFDFIQEERLADRYEDGIPETIEEVVKLVEERTGLVFKQHSYKSFDKVVYRCKYKKVNFELYLDRFKKDVHNGSKFISTRIEASIWGRSVPAYDIDETLKLVKRWKKELDG